MIFSLDHHQCAADIVEYLAEALLIKETPWPKKLARLYLVNDILHNAGGGEMLLKSGWSFRGEIEKNLPQIFEHLGQVMDLNTTDEKIEVSLSLNTTYEIYDFINTTYDVINSHL